MARVHHDRLGEILHTLVCTGNRCGSLNLQTGQAEYCGYDCPTLKQRMLADEDPATPINGADGLTFVPFDGV